MSESSNPTGPMPAEGEHLPEWHECDVFCIRHYASVGDSACGWRGRTTHGGQALHACPRCGFATLLRIPRVTSVDRGTNP